MHNVYITRLLQWGRIGTVELANKALSRVGSPVRLRRAMSTMKDMCTLEQRINLFHLADQICALDVPGAVVELGTFVGETAIVMGRVLSEHKRSQDLHLFDAFEMGFDVTKNPRTALDDNFRSAGLPTPTIHEGRFDRTIPGELPEKIALCHIDCGFGGDPESHRDTIVNLLRHVYPRLSPGGIVVFMDYCDLDVARTWNGNPGVKLACDVFFADKPEKLGVLWAGDGAQGYLRKARA